MRSKEDLFHLIKAMSKSEKRYFTLDAQKSGKKGSKYLDLFQAINNMDEYEESKLKKKFPKNLSSDKAYLYDAILRSMRDYRSSKSKAAQIKEMILDSRYLYERGLYSQCEERLKEAEDLALLMDDQLSSLEVIKEKRQLVWDLRKKNYEEEIQSILLEKEQSLKHLNEEFKLLDLYDQLSTMVMKKLDLDDEDSRNALKQRFRIEDMELEELPGSPRAVRRFYLCAAIYYHLLGNFNKVELYYQKVVDWWDANPSYKDEEFYKYVVDISNLLHAWYRKGEFRKIPELLDKIQEETSTNVHDQKIVFHRLSMFKLLYFINSGQTAGIDNLIQEIEFGLKEFKVNPVSRLMLVINLAVLLFIHASYAECMEWCQRVIKGKKIDSRKNLQNGIYLLYLAAVYESEDLDVVENTIRAVQRFFQQDETITKQGAFELRVVDYFKKMINAPLNELNDVFRSFKDYLKEAKANPDIKVNVGSMDELLLHWASSKIERRTVLQLLTA
jgi:hypothetical protein